MTEKEKKEFDRFLNWLTQPQEPEDPNGKHTHVCPNPKCGFKWSHENSCVDNTPAHTCRECGTEQWEYDVRDTGGEFTSCMAAPTVTQNL